MSATLMHMVAKVHYGGRVTDKWDQRCVQCLLKRFLDRGTAIGKLEVPFDDEGVYYAPSSEFTQKECIEFIQKFPMSGDPTVSGLHEVRPASSAAEHLPCSVTYGNLVCARNCGGLQTARRKFQQQASATLMSAIIDASNTVSLSSR
jgi:dynein heavy chain